jgi:hypothetical protein
LGDLDQAFADVAVPRRETTHEEQVHQQVEVGGDRLPVDGQRARQGGGVEQAALLVSEHRPEPAQGFRGDARTELWNVAFQVGANEIHAPAQAGGVGLSQQAVRETTAQPKRVQTIATDLTHIQRREFQITDAPGERLTGLPQQFDRRQAQHEKASRALTVPPAGIDEPAQAPKQVRRALDFVEYDELVCMLWQVQLGFRNSGPISLGLQIQIDRRPPFGDSQRESSLADLSRTKQCHGRRLGQCGGELVQQAAGEHSCN